MQAHNILTRYRRRNRPGCLTAMLIVIIGVGLGAAGGLGWFGPGVSQSGAPSASTPLAADGASNGGREGVELAPDGFPVEPRQHVLKYTVKAGDALILIAEKFGISPDTIFWANKEILQDNVNLILIGTQLYILPVDGVYHQSDGQLTVQHIAQLYGVTADDILKSKYNLLSQYDGSYVPPAGLRIVVPGGRRDYISWQSPIQTGSSTGMANPQGSIHPGSCREHYTGIGGSGVYINPLKDTPYRVTTGFETWHPGVDMAADRGTPIYAADTGIIVFAGWHRVGYGELIIIDHGNGWTTYYGHLSARYVGCGDQVVQGQLIGLMGATGNATGYHLHFEIREADIPQNPYLYITLQDTREAEPIP